MDWSLAQTETMIEENASNSYAEADIKIEDVQWTREVLD